jgi:hypothetical protein
MRSDKSGGATELIAPVEDDSLALALGATRVFWRRYTSTDFGFDWVLTSHPKDGSPTEVDPKTSTAPGSGGGGAIEIAHGGIGAFAADEETICWSQTDGIRCQEADADTVVVGTEASGLGLVGRALYACSGDGLRRIDLDAGETQLIDDRRCSEITIGASSVFYDPSQTLALIPLGGGSARGLASADWISDFAADENFLYWSVLPESKLLRIGFR